MAARTRATITASRIEESILLLRGHKVLLDATLASLYGVQAKALVQAVKRNRERLPPDFLFELTNQKVAVLRSHSVTPSWGGRRYANSPASRSGANVRSKRARWNGVMTDD